MDYFDSIIMTKDEINDSLSRLIAGNLITMKDEKIKITKHGRVFLKGSFFIDAIDWHIKIQDRISKITYDETIVKNKEYVTEFVYKNGYDSYKLKMRNIIELIKSEEKNIVYKFKTNKVVRNKETELSFDEFKDEIMKFNKDVIIENGLIVIQNPYHQKNITIVNENNSVSISFGRVNILNKCNMNKDLVEDIRHIINNKVRVVVLKENDVYRCECFWDSEAKNEEEVNDLHDKAFTYNKPYSLIKKIFVKLQKLEIYSFKQLYTKNIGGVYPKMDKWHGFLSNIERAAADYVELIKAYLTKYVIEKPNNYVINNTDYLLVYGDGIILYLKEMRKESSFSRECLDELSNIWVNNTIDLESLNELVNDKLK